MSSTRKFKVKDCPELDEIRKGFEQYDYEKKGTINPHDLRKTMDQMNMYDKNPAIYEIIKSLCLKDFKDSEISYDEFIDAITKKFSSENNNKENLKQIFDVFTEPRSNTITLSSFVQIARELRETVSEVEIKEMLQNAGENGNEINFEEFYEIMTKNVDLNENLNSKNESKNESKNNSKRESRTNVKYTKKVVEKDNSDMNSKRSSYNSGRRSKA